MNLKTGDQIRFIDSYGRTLKGTVGWVALCPCESEGAKKGATYVKISVTIQSSNSPTYGAYLTHDQVIEKVLRFCDLPKREQKRILAGGY